MVNFAFSFSPHTNCKRTEKLSRNVSEKCSVQKDGEKLLCFSVVLCMVCMQLFNQGIRHYESLPTARQMILNEAVNSVIRTDQSARVFCFRAGSPRLSCKNRVLGRL